MFYLAALTAAVWCRAGEETADTVLARSESIYTGSDTITAQAYQRRVYVPVREMPGGRANFGPPASYRVMVLKKKKPDDWYFASWGFYGSGAGQAGFPGAVRPSGYLLAKAGATPGRMISFGGASTPKGSGNSLTDDEFSQTLHHRMLGQPTALSAFMPLMETPPGEAKAPFGLQNAKLTGEEMWNQRATYRIDGIGVMGGPMVAWIDKESGLILRTVMQEGSGMGMFRMMTETIYTTTLNKKLGAFDFEAKPPVTATEVLSEDEMGFGASAVLAAYATGTDGGQAGGLNRGFPSSQPVVPAAAPVPGVAEQQALSMEQMEGIVLIEGDASTATGFMTKMRGVDFVVTNQHVLGENKKITLKNLHGEVVPVQAIFAAVGSDIAILRVPAAQGALKVADDVLKSVKIGDKIVVVGNRLGGGVATQTSGQVLGVGPTRIEVNANFEPGNSGSPIFSTTTQEVVGVATYAETRKVAVEETAAPSRYGEAGQAPVTKLEKRWFGYRLDSVTKWEAIDLAKWHAQGERVEKFRDFSEALVAVIRSNFKKAAVNERLGPVIADFQMRAAQKGTNRMGVAGDVKSLFNNIRGMAETGLRDFEAAEYYDYYRTCLYWEESVPMQADYRKAIIEVLKKYESNSDAYVSRMRNGG